MHHIRHTCCHLTRMPEMLYTHQASSLYDTMAVHLTNAVHFCLGHLLLGLHLIILCLVQSEPTPATGPWQVHPSQQCALVPEALECVCIHIYRYQYIPALLEWVHAAGLYVPARVLLLGLICSAPDS
jgi:hypothetical protein